MKQTLNPVWEDTFELDVLAPSQQLLVDVYDRDWMLGIPLKPDYMGRITVPLSSVPDGPVGITQWYAILDADTNTPLHGKVQLTLRKKQLEEMESKASFWSLFKGDKVCVGMLVCDSRLNGHPELRVVQRCARERY